MSIITVVSRKSLHIRILSFGIHFILILGAITMIYPFLLMISSSLKSAVDSTSMSIIPRYLYDDNELYRKYIESRYNEESQRLGDNYYGKYLSFAEVSLPAVQSRMLKDWHAFVQTQGMVFDEYHYYVSEQYGRGVYPLNQRILRALLRSEADGELGNFNRKYNTGVQSWEEIVIEEKAIQTRNFISAKHGYMGRYKAFKKNIPLWDREFVNLDGNFVKTELMPEFKGNLDSLNSRLGTSYAAWEKIPLTERYPAPGSIHEPLQKYWFRYVSKILSIRMIQILPVAEERYRAMLKARYPSLKLTPHSPSLIPQNLPDSGKEVEDYTYFIENLALPTDLGIRSIQTSYRKWLKTQYTDIDDLNKAWALPYQSYADITLSSSYPQDNIFSQHDWWDFAINQIPDRIMILPIAQMLFLDFVKELYPTQTGELNLARYNLEWQQNASQSIDIYPPETQPTTPSAKALWLRFLREKLRPEYISMPMDDSLQTAFRAYLQAQYGDIAQLNTAWKRGFPDFESIAYPVAIADFASFTERKASIRWEFLTRNYAMVLDQMLNDAGSLKNTLIYCLLSILIAVTVNPLAAYALSRFKPRLTYQMIMLFMLTMAFPTMVMGIPNFLMLKRLNLLNTFWALILPAAADGYFIFLLKGFFDSLPKELYESARLDGAGEFRLFWQFTLYLSKPILAVIALGAFNAAYRNFLFAFIVCQDQSMWTLMVHIYELMQRASNSVGFAALVIAAIPTLLVFVFFQNMIIKGIVVPMEK